LNGSKLESLIYLPIFTVLDFILVSTFDIAEFASEKHCSISQHFMSFIINSSINWVDPFKIDLHFNICNLKWQIQYLENSRINICSADKVVGSECRTAAKTCQSLVIGAVQLSYSFIFTKATKTISVCWSSIIVTCLLLLLQISKLSFICEFWSWWLKF